MFIVTLGSAAVVLVLEISYLIPKVTRYAERLRRVEEQSVDGSAVNKRHGDDSGRGGADTHKESSSIKSSSHSSLGVVAPDKTIKP